MGKRIVLDTNVIVSAFGWKGAPRIIFQKCIIGHLNLYLSPPLLLEIRRVLSYPKFHFNIDEIDEFFSIVIETAEIVEPELTINLISQDLSDNRVLECAVTADCEFIVSGDKHLLELKEFGDIKILTPDELIKLL